MVLAESESIAFEYIAEQDQANNKYVYIDSLNRVVAVVTTHIVRLGAYWRHPEFERINALLEGRLRLYRYYSIEDI